MSGESFSLMAAVVTFIPPLQASGAWIVLIAKRTFVMTLFLIGSSFTRPAIKDVGPKILFQGVALWLVVSAGSLALIRSGWIANP